MCTLLIWNSAHPRYPLIAAANRDEDLERASSGPQRLSVDPIVVGGRDEVAGGTWFACNAKGFFVALTNRRGAGTHDPAKRSRGALVLDVARAPSIDEALERAGHASFADYNPYVLVVAGVGRSVAFEAGAGGMTRVPIGAGAHAVTNWETDARSPRRAARALEAARATVVGAYDDGGELAHVLHRMLADHGVPEGSDEAMCVHDLARGYGTRSSTIALLGADPADTRLFHAEGPPCRATLVEVTALLRDERGAAAPNSG